MEWQPIETAPKDGTEIIAIHYTQYSDGLRPMIDGPFTSAFHSGEWLSSWNGSEVIESEHWGGTEYKSILEPTHWMPPPQPPQQGRWNDEIFRGKTCG